LERGIKGEGAAPPLAGYPPVKREKSITSKSYSISLYERETIDCPSFVRRD